MSLKDWKNNELRTVLSERWGFSLISLMKVRKKKLDEAKHEDEELDEGAASSGRVATLTEPKVVTVEDDERKRPMEEGEKMPMKTDTRRC